LSETEMVILRFFLACKYSVSSGQIPIKTIISRRVIRKIIP